MSITFTKADASSITLIDGITRAQDKIMGPANESGDATVAIQPRSPVRASSAKPIARGGAENIVTFSGTRLCASATTARQWLYGHIAACQAAGTGTLNLASGTIANCTIERISWNRRGATVFITYTCRGGAISAS